MNIHLISLFAVTLLKSNAFWMDERCLFAKVWMSWLYNCRHFGPEKKMLSQYTPLCLGEGEGVWWSCSTFCLLLSEPLSKKISQWVLPCTLTNHIKVVYLVTHHRKKVIGPQITHVNNAWFNYKICLTNSRTNWGADISFSPSYFLMKSTWIHSIELHSEKQLVRRLQSCT